MLNLQGSSRLHQCGRYAELEVGQLPHCQTGPLGGLTFVLLMPPVQGEVHERASNDGNPTIMSCRM